MSDTHSQNSQAKAQPKQSSSLSAADAASLRRSKRPKTPSLLYADGFEDTQKVIGRKGNPKPFRTSNKNAGDNLSTSEKEGDLRMEEELLERVPSYADKTEFEDDDEYLPFIKPDDMETNSDDRVGYVTFKFLFTEEGKSNQRKLKKKAPYGEDFAYGIDSKKPKDKIKVQVKKAKPINTKPTPAPSTQDFLDIVLSAAIKAQASQTPAEANQGPKSPITGYNSASNSVHMSGKVSAPKFGGLEDKPIGIIKKTKASVKKSEPVKAYNATNDEFYQRQLEYKDHYIKEVVMEGDQIVLKHTKNAPITMKYHKRKFNLRRENLVNSKIFDVVAGKETTPMEEENGENKQENDWKKKLQTKEQALTLHFKEILKDYKPSILA